MKHQWGRIFFAGLIVLIITIILNFPAQIAVNILVPRFNAPLKWERIEGTLFNVKLFGVSASSNSGVEFYIDQLSLKSSRLSLFSGRLDSVFAIIQGEMLVNGKSQFGIKKWNINELEGEIKLNDLTQSFPEFSFVGLTGSVHITSKLISGNYGELPDQGNIKIIITELSSEQIKSDRPLGNYEIKIDVLSKSRINGTILNISGENQLYISSRAIFDKPGKDLQISGQAWVANDADPSVQEILLLLGKYENNRTIIDWSSKINN